MLISHAISLLFYLFYFQGVHPIVEAAVDNTSNHAPEVHVAEAEPLALEPSPSLVPTLLDPNGWILAFSILAASRLGRASAQEARLDVRLVLQERQRNRAFGSELRRKREIWLQQEAERKLGEDAKRLVCHINFCIHSKL